VILPDGFFEVEPYLWMGAVVWLALWWRWLTKTTKRQKVLFSAGIIVSIAMWRFGPTHPRVAIVRFSKLGAPVEKRHGRLLFPMRYTFQNGNVVWLWSLSGKSSLDKYFGTIVVNDSPETLRIQFVSYASSEALGLGETPPTPVPPMSTFPWTNAIDNIGPDDTPPESISSPISVGVISWLTWGNAPDE
jgi:hypothetical protein